MSASARAWPVAAGDGAAGALVGVEVAAAGDEACWGVHAVAATQAKRVTFTGTKKRMVFLLA